MKLIIFQHFLFFFGGGQNNYTNEILNYFFLFNINDLMLLQKLIFVQKINKCTYDIILLVCQLAINEII